MNIGILGSVTSVIPPNGQAAIERLVYIQALELAKRGHHILLFAPHGSHVDHPNVTIVEVADKVMLSGSGKEGIQTGEELYGTSYKLRLELVNLARVQQELMDRKDQYDVILNNIRGEAVILPVATSLGKPVFHVLHLPVFPELATLFHTYHTRMISISEAQKKANPDLSYAGTAYNAVNMDEFTFSPDTDGYVLYLGSIGRNKNPKDAILAALKAGVPIKIGGRIKDSAYYTNEIQPLVDGKHVIWVGEQSATEVVRLYQKAKAFLFPTLWEEPFGLVLIEAMSCGTPVIAYPNGAIPEIVENGVNGYLVSSVDEMAEKIKVIGEMSREKARASVAAKFTISHMIDSYEKILNICRNQ